jgi:hypothetical protein
MIFNFLKFNELLEFLELQATKRYLLIITLYSVASYSLYLFFNEEFMIKVGEEDGIFEYLTAFFFITTSIVAVILFVRSKVIWFALLAIVFFVGFGEEISWGQRILGYGTPESVNTQNIQGEFNIHNLEILDSKDFSGTEKSGWKKFTAVQFLYNLFWLAYAILVPLAFFYFAFVKNLATTFKLPVPALSIGLFFLIDWFMFRITKSFLLPPQKSLHYYYTINEIFESCSALIFMMILIFFLEKYQKSKRGI